MELVVARGPEAVEFFLVESFGPRNEVTCDGACEAAFSQAVLHATNAHRIPLAEESAQDAAMPREFTE